MALDINKIREIGEKVDFSLTISDMSKEDNPLVYVNSTFIETTGHKEEFCLGRNCRFLQGDETDPSKVNNIRKAIENYEFIITELINYRKGGESFINRLVLIPFKSQQLYFGIQNEVRSYGETDHFNSEGLNFFKKGVIYREFNSDNSDNNSFQKPLDLEQEVIQQVSALIKLIL